ncbi:MAG: LOG family protein [Rickettsiales bacterium]|nr:LOG family protein [Rickettsiales bacterium]
MPIVRLSGRVLGAEDPKRKDRAELLYHIFANGWDIYNSNGDQSVRLENIQKKIIETDAFVFTPSPSLEDYFNLSSIFVGFQTNDSDLTGKSAIIVNSDESWNSFLEMCNHLKLLGTVKQNYSEFVEVVKASSDVVEKLKATKISGSYKPSDEPDFVNAGAIYKENESHIKKPKFKVCVFCSASIKKKDYLEEGYNLGGLIAKKNWGCISGAGKTGIMGEVVRGAYENGGWSAGSNVPHIIQMEGLPDGLNEFWPRGDIYTRMEVMIRKSNAFVIMPGGMGTVQELFALLLLKHQNNDLMRDKKIVIYNKLDSEFAKRFWNPILEIIKKFENFNCNFQVANEFEEIIPLLEQKCEI